MKKYFLIPIMILFFVACSEDNTNSPNYSSSNFTPKIGSKLYFDFYDLNENDQMNSEPTTIDNYIQISSAGTIENKPALLFGFYDSNNELYSMELYSYDSLNQKVYIHNSYLNYVADEFRNYASAGDSIPIYFDEPWYPIADFNKDSWTLVDRDIVNYEFSEIFHAKMDGKYLVKCSKGVLENINIGGTTYPAQEFVLEAKFDGTMLSDGVSKPSTIYMKNSIFIVKGIGKVKNITYAGEINTPFSNTKLLGNAMMPKRIE